MSDLVLSLQVLGKLEGIGHDQLYCPHDFHLSRVVLNKVLACRLVGDVFQHSDLCDTVAAIDDFLRWSSMRRTKARGLGLRVVEVLFFPEIKLVLLEALSVGSPPFRIFASQVSIVLGILFLS